MAILRYAVALVPTLAFASLALAQPAVDLSFYYPIVVGGPITKIIDGLTAEFEKENPGVSVHAIYSGTYRDSVMKALTASKSGTPPVMSILGSADMYTLIDEDAIVPFDDVVKTDDDKRWLQSFYPEFMENSRTRGKTWGIPFQRSTIVLCWNKAMFKEAGLDPDRPPRTWDEQLEYARKLTKRDASGKVTQWGIEIPSGTDAYYFQALAIQNGVELANEAGTQTYFDRPEVLEALRYWVDLSVKHKVHPEGVVEFAAPSRDFLQRSAAMIWTTTGTLTNVRNNAKFAFGVAMLPAHKRRGSPAGGGNFYLFSRSTPQQRDAALKFIRWITTPTRAAQWGIDTGYIAVRPDAWDTPAMKKYVSAFPAAAVARDQLRYAKAELSTHDNERVNKALNDGLQAALTGSKTPEHALQDAQREAERLLRPFR